MCDCATDDKGHDCAGYTGAQEKKAMSNPTREEVEHWIKTCRQRLAHDVPDDEIADWSITLGEAYLRALDMRDEIYEAVESRAEHIGNTRCREIYRAIHKFDGG